MSSYKSPSFTAALALAVVVTFISGPGTAAPRQQLNCTETCTADPGVSVPPAVWSVSWNSTQNGSATVNCVTPCTKCKGEVTYLYTGTGPALLNVKVWNSATGAYETRYQEDLTGHESGVKLAVTACDEVPWLFEFTSPEGNVTAALGCPCQQ